MAVEYRSDVNLLNHLQARNFGFGVSFITTEASTLTLDSGSSANIVFEGSVSGQIVKLLDATSPCINQGHEFRFFNISSIPVQIDDFESNTLAWIMPGGFLKCLLQGISLSIGPWLIESSPNKIDVTLDFGSAYGPENDTVYTTVLAPWVKASSALTATLGGPTADHDLEDAAIENIVLSIGNIVPGVGFDLVAHSNQFSWGKYSASVIAV